MVLAQSTLFVHHWDSPILTFWRREFSPNEREAEPKDLEAGKLVNAKDIFKVIATVLQLANTKFDAPPSNSEGSTVMKECDAAFDIVSRLTAVDRKSLESALCTSVRVTRREKIRSPVNVRQGSDNRDALSRTLFGLVFNFVVRMGERVHRAKG